MGGSDDGFSDEDLLERWPRVRLDADNAPFYDGLLRGQLVLRRCAECGWWHHPPRPLCARCWSWNVVPAPIAGRGLVALVTRRGPAHDASTPRPVVAVELIEQPGLRVSGELVTPEGMGGDPRPGLAVSLGWEDRDGRPAPVWYPRDAGSP